MIKTKTLIKRKSKGGLVALALLLSLIALVASMLITQSVAEKAEASRFGTCPAGQVLRGQRLSSGGYRLYCVRRAPTTTNHHHHHTTHHHQSTNHHQSTKASAFMQCWPVLSRHSIRSCLRPMPY